jgi:hypothetical protein
MSYELFVEQLNKVEQSYPKLKCKLKEHGYVLAGELDIIDAYGKLWESYQVEIRHEEGFPHRFPSLYEVGGKIPKIGDWHIYEDTLACCVKVKPAEIIRCVNGISVAEFIKEEALPYLFNQTHRRLEGYYVNGEYSHGIVGFSEFYTEELKTGLDIKKTLKLMHFIAKNDRPERTSMCFCGSGIKFRNCHREAFDKLKKIGENLLLSHCYAIGKSEGIFE